MEQKVGPLLNGVVVECVQNSDGRFDGVIATNNNKKFDYFDHEISLELGSNCSFNMATSNKEHIDFEAINIKLI